ncbi:hypothetical protein AAHE18_01G140500 [Arachis hypogaea]
MVDCFVNSSRDKIAAQIDKNLRELEDFQERIEIVEPEFINNAFESVVRNKTCVLGSGGGSQSSKSNMVQQPLAELEAQKRETGNARKECNETRAKLVEVESQLNEEQKIILFLKSITGLEQLPAIE